MEETNTLEKYLDIGIRILQTHPNKEEWCNIIKNNSEVDFSCLPFTIQQMWEICQYIVNIYSSNFLQQICDYWKTTHDCKQKES